MVWKRETVQSCSQNTFERVDSEFRGRSEESTEVLPIESKNAQWARRNGRKQTECGRRPRGRGHGTRARRACAPTCVSRQKDLTYNMQDTN
eukprot:6204915-Pleurochrysis_carterae.AAC.2